jgi:hypothetical protein
MFCSNCGRRLPDDAEYCDNCNTPTPLAAESGGKEPGPEAAVQQVEAPSELPAADSPMAEDEPQSLSLAAAEAAGETALGVIGGELKDAANAMIPGPAKAIGDGIKSLFSSIGAALKDPKSLIPAFILAGIWLVINILRACGVYPASVKALSFLSFAGGGTNGGFIGAVGGLIGKGALVGAVTSLIGLFTAQEKSEKRSFGESLKGAFGFDLNNVWPYVLGAGVAFFLFLFISGGAARTAFMGGAAASYLSARAANRNGFLKKLIGSFGSKSSGNTGKGAHDFISGLASGFGVSSLIGLSDIDLILIILGAVLVLGGAVMMILKAAGVLNKGKEAAAQ